jgi:hypothetical protein
VTATRFTIVTGSTSSMGAGSDADCTAPHDPRRQVRRATPVHQVEKRVEIDVRSAARAPASSSLNPASVSRRRRHRATLAVGLGVGVGGIP